MKIQIVVANDDQTPDWVSVLAANGNDVALCEENQAVALNLTAQTVVLLLAPLDELVALAKACMAQQARVYIITSMQAIDPLRQRHILEAVAEDVGAGFIDLAAQQSLTQDPSLDGLVQYLSCRIRTPFQPVDYYFGASTYPEVWDDTVMQHDIAEMKRLGMNMTRLGEFSWHAIEPTPGHYCFAWLEKSLQAFEAAGIAVLLAIPTPTPPRWLTAGHPELCVVDDTGQIMVHGSRQHVCLNNAISRGHALQMTRKLATVATRHKNVIGFQLDNEFKAHVDQCFCETCQADWPVWLAAEYGDIDTLNAAWGTCVWSEAYASFDEVPPPMKTPFLHNSALQNAYRRFTTASVERFAEQLADTIREVSLLPITHNSAMGFNLDNHRLFSRLDFAGFDTYASSGNYPAFSLNLDLWRNLLPGTYMLLETSPSHGGSLRSYGVPHPSGYLANELFLNFAADSHGFNLWHMRGHRFGVEQPHGAVLTAWGEPDVGYPEVVAAGQTFREIIPLLKQTKFMRPRVALMVSDEAKRFYAIESGGIYDHRGLITAYYTALLNAGISVDVIQPGAKLAGYAVVLVPYVRHVSAALCARFAAFVKAGGRLILGPMTGDRTHELTWPQTNGLDQLGQWLGFHQIMQYRVRDAAPVNGLVTAFTPPETWHIDRIADNGQALVATHDHITYVGGLPEDLATSWWPTFIKQQIAPYDADQSWLTLAQGLIKYGRQDAMCRYYFVANMTAIPHAVSLKRKALVNGKSAGARLIVPPFAHVVITMPESEGKDGDNSLS